MSLFSADVEALRVMANRDFGVVSTEFWHVANAVQTTEVFAASGETQCLQSSYDLARGLVVDQIERAQQVLAASAEALSDIAEVYAIADGQG